MSKYAIANPNRLGLKVTETAAQYLERIAQPKHEVTKSGKKVGR